MFHQMLKGKLIMKSTLLSASVLALATLAAGSSYAEGREPFPEVNAPSLAQSATTRAEVKAELLQAQRQGFSANIARNWNGDVEKNGVSSVSRAEVRNEAIAALAGNDSEFDGGRL
jgi:hypothetical protein